jgi:signal transduction histidine kinase/DNA-binding response OmpR family regulator/ligand-binding sensor domain-containing protein
MIEDGLTSNRIYDILEDNYGFIWIATNDGLIKYDGTRFQVYRHQSDNPKSLPDNIIHELEHGEGNDILISVWDKGLYKYCYAKDEFLPHISTLRDDRSERIKIRDIINTKDILWIGANQGLFYYNKLNDSIYLLPYKDDKLNTNAITDRCIFDLKLVNDSILWAATFKGLNRIAVKSNEVSHYFANDLVHAIADHTVQNALIVNTDKGSFKYNRDQDTFEKISGKQIENVFTFKAISYLVHTDQSLHLQQDFDFSESALQKSNILTKDFIKSNKDSRGIFWISSWNDGLFYIYPYEKDVLFHTYEYDRMFSLQNMNVHAIESYTDHKFLTTVGRNNIGVFDIKSKDFTKIIQIIYGDPDDEYIKMISAGFLNKVFVGTTKNLYMLNEKNLQGQKKILTNTAVKGIFVNDDHLIAINTDNILFLDTLSFTIQKRFSINTESTNDKVIIRQGIKHKNALWLATNKGIKKFNLLNQSFENVIDSEINKIHTAIVGSIAIDDNDNIWAGTLSQGLFFIRAGQRNVYHLSTNNILSSNSIFSILLDNQDVWIGSTLGLTRIRYYPQENDFTAESFFKEDGLPSNFFMPNSAAFVGDNLMAFGSNNGLTIFNPDDFIQNTPQPVIYWKNAIFEGEKLQTGVQTQNFVLDSALICKSKLNIPYQIDNFKIQFSILDFFKQGRYNIYYSIGGDNWIKLDNQSREISFNALSPGEKVLTLKISSSYNKKPLASNQLLLNVEPHFTNKLYFQIIVFAFVLILVISIIHIRTRNISRRKMILEKMVRKRTKELEEKNVEIKTMADTIHEIDQAKIQFFTNISHEIRTPLTLISSPVERLLESNQDISKDEIFQKLKLISNNTNRLTRLINQLLDFKKVESGNIVLMVEEVEVIDKIRVVYNSFVERSKEKEIEYNYDHPDEPINGYIDIDKIDKIVFNLLSNAYKYTPVNGKISLAIRSYQSKDNQKWLIISVSDNGKGIPENKIKNIFNRFYQIGSEANSTGIGLSLTKSLVDIHKGKIDVKSKQGKGSTFTVEIPVEKSAYTDKELADFDDEDIKNELIREETSKPQFDVEMPYNLLIIEDNEELLHYLMHEFANYYNCTAAKNGKEGYVKAINEIPDIILTDVMMPEMNGVDLCKELKNNLVTSHIPVVMLTAKAGEGNEVVGFESGADAYIKKPFNFSVLLARLRNLIKNRELLKELFSNSIKDVQLDESTSSSKMTEPFLEKIKWYVEENILVQSIDVDDLAKEIGLSRSQVYRKMKAVSNHTLFEYIKIIKLKHAVKLLKTKKYNISEVSDMSGFSSQNYFARAFKEQFGITPSHFISKYS